VTISLTDMLGLNNRFHVSISGVDLGAWGACDGLLVDFQPEPIKQGGIYDYMAYLPGQLKYSPITLRRAINPSDSAKVQGWLAQMVNDWVHNKNAPDGGHGTITLFSSEAKPVMSWTLRNTYPSKWTGPKLDAMTAGIAMETLEIVHEGFL
jgi:phage tail-like protein